MAQHNRDRRMLAFLLLGWLFAIGAALGYLMYSGVDKGRWSHDAARHRQQPQPTR